VTAAVFLLSSTALATSFIQLEPASKALTVDLDDGKVMPEGTKLQIDGSATNSK